MKKILPIALNTLVLIYIVYSFLDIRTYSDGLEMDIKITRKEKVAMPNMDYENFPLEDWLAGKWEADELRYDAAIQLRNWSFWTLGILLIYNLFFFANRIMGKRKGKGNQP